MKCDRCGNEAANLKRGIRFDAALQRDVVEDLCSTCVSFMTASPGPGLSARRDPLTELANEQADPRAPKPLGRPRIHPPKVKSETRGRPKKKKTAVSLEPKASKSRPDPDSILALPTAVPGDFAEEFAQIIEAGGKRGISLWDERGEVERIRDEWAAELEASSKDVILFQCRVDVCNEILEKMKESHDIQATDDRRLQSAV